MCFALKFVYTFLTYQTKRSHGHTCDRDRYLSTFVGFLTSSSRNTPPPITDGGAREKSLSVTVILNVSVPKTIRRYSSGVMMNFIVQFTSWLLFTQKRRMYSPGGVLL